MLIGIDASRANRAHKSGTEWYSFYLIKALAALDDKNQYILYTDQPLTNGLVDLSVDKPDFRSRQAEYDKQGYQIINSPHNNFKGKVLNWPLKFFWTLGRLSWEMLRRAPEILFVPAHGLPLIHPRKSLVTIHDLGFKEDRRLYSGERLGYAGRFNHWLVSFFTRGRYEPTPLDYLDWSTGFALKRARAIITISEFSRTEILKHYPELPAEKINVVLNGFNTALFRPDQDPKRLAAVLGTYGFEQPYLFYVGRLEKKKNIGRLIEAYAMAKHKYGLKHKLYLIGDASFGYDEIKYLINEFAVEGEVVTTGWIEESHLPFIFAGADAFVFPSRYEGFGIPLLQAMAAGTPIVASQAAAIPEVAGEAALYFDPDNINEMAEAMVRVVRDQTLRERLIAAGLERAAEFSWEKCAKETLRVIESL